MQFQSDLLNIPVIRPKTTETTALGAAYLAGLAVRFWQDENDLAKHWQIDKVFKPTNHKQALNSYKNYQKALDRAKGWTNK
jgi:glycerol kinase